jgi:hypothetical protein
MRVLWACVLFLMVTLFFAEIRLHYRLEHESVVSETCKLPLPPLPSDGANIAINSPARPHHDVANPRSAHSAPAPAT